MTRTLVILGLGLLLSPAAARPVENRISLDPRSTSVEQLDLQILRRAAEHCVFPTPQDTLRVALHYEIPIRLSDAYDAWGQPFVYNEPAILGDAQFDLYSVGANGIDERGEGDDITNWTLRRDIAETWASRDDLTFWSRAYRTQRLIHEGERTAGSDGRARGSSTERAETTTTPAETRGSGILPRILLLDGVVLLIAAAVWRRRLGLAALVLATLTTSGVASAIEPGAIYRYTESQVYYLRWSILDFRATTCRYPAPDDTFATLAHAGLDSLATLGGARDYWGQPFVLRVPSSVEGEFFDLYSVGRNGLDERGRGDDIGVDKAQRVFEMHYAPTASGDHGAKELSDAKGQDPAPDAERPTAAGRERPGTLARAGHWLATLDGPFVLLGLLWLRRRRAGRAVHV